MHMEHDTYCIVSCLLFEIFVLISAKTAINPMLIKQYVHSANRSATAIFPSTKYMPIRTKIRPDKIKILVPLRSPVKTPEYTVRIKTQIVDICTDRYG